MEVPQYNAKESLTKYIEKVEKYKTMIYKDKYNIILNFINEWLKLFDEKKFKSITDFKNLYEVDLLYDNRNNKKVIKKYVDIFEKQFMINLNITDDTDSDEIKEKYIIYILSKVVNNIDYILIKKEYNGKIYYTIKKN
jgi:hypothetical protein